MLRNQTSNFVIQNSRIARILVRAVWPIFARIQLRKAHGKYSLDVRARTALRAQVENGAPLLVRTKKADGGRFLPGLNFEEPMTNIFEPHGAHGCRIPYFDLDQLASIPKPGYNFSHHLRMSMDASTKNRRQSQRG